MEIAGANDLPDAVMTDGSFLAYRISPGDLPAPESIYKKIFSASNRHPFCLLVTKEAAGLDGLTDLILTLSFHHNYYKVDFGIPVLLFEATDADQESTLSACRNALLEQGYDDLDCVVIGSHDAYSWPGKGTRGFHSDLTVTDPEKLSQLYDRLFGSTELTELSFFLNVQRSSDLIEGTRSLLKADEQARDRHPATYALWQAFRLHQETQCELRFTIGLLQQRLASQMGYHSFYNPAESHVGRQIMEITEFYKYEYEILPLWYKRLGHIIKVLMGKRTLKSLFSDRVKKYKV
jgi:hypothetical protein